MASPGRCELLQAQATPDTIVVGVPGQLDLAHAPVPETAGERLVFGTLYEPLVRLDCDGRAIPALAARWTEDGPRRWQFTLRPDARFWDGTPVTSRDVVAAWTLAGGTVAFAESLSTPNPRTLTVLLARPDTAILRQLADPRLAVALPAANGGPPQGTTPYRVTAWTDGEIDAAAADRPGSLLRFQLAGGADPRDLLDAGADLLLTGDPDALKYAAGRDGYDVEPLPWAWTYVATGELFPLHVDSVPSWGLTDAVHGDVRVAQPPFWWAGAPRCPEWLQRPSYHPPSMARTIVYQARDRMARDVAARLAALLAEDSTPSGLAPLGIRGLDPDAWADALAQDRALAFVTTLPRRAYATCVDLPAGPIVPLLDARRSLIARRGRAHVVVEWDGTPRLVPP